MFDNYIFYDLFNDGYNHQLLHQKYYFKQTSYYKNITEN